MNYDCSLRINEREISISSPTYFIADIASNHDGELSRAMNLIRLAKEAGADAVKFQHFKAEDIVSDQGFRKMGQQVSHQASWKESVFDVYKKYECNREWTSELLQTAHEVEIDFFTTPYDFEALEIFKDLVPAFKIGSGDITWTEFIRAVSCLGKPIILSSGASSIEDVVRAVETAVDCTRQIAILQCNTNYTGRRDNFKYVNLNVLRTYSVLYPGMILGLSDHTPGYAAVLGAVALGARIVEKHFTDDNSREGPDHAFALDPQCWKKMVIATRELEMAIGDGIKRVEENERETYVVQRRCLRVKKDMKAGDLITMNDIDVLRPAPRGAIPPYKLEAFLNKSLRNDKECGDALFYYDFGENEC